MGRKQEIELEEELAVRDQDISSLEVTIERLEEKVEHYAEEIQDQRNYILWLESATTILRPRETYYALIKIKGEPL
jgi:predicted RNase H-like nuclease (RuvC/YqgF family)